MLGQRSGLAEALVMATARVRLIELVRQSRCGKINWKHGRLLLPAAVSDLGHQYYAEMECAQADLRYCDAAIEFFTDSVCSAAAEHLVREAMMVLSR